MSEIKEHDKRQLDYPADRVAKVLSLIKKGDNTRDIAKQLNFDSHRSMAQYMGSKGYIWDENVNTYVKNYTFEQTEKKEEQSNKQQVTNENKVDIQKYAALLEYLDQRKDRLGDLFEETEADAKMPRYIVSGIHITKSVHMVYELDQLVREFSKEKNISQKEIFEVALINFLKRYGYNNEVEALLER